MKSRLYFIQQTKTTYFQFLLLLMIASFSAKGQVLFNMQGFRNLVYGGGGYSPSYANSTIGVGRKEYVKIIKKEIIGFLDLSFPATGNFITKYTFRKGIQFDVYKKNAFRFPITIASSSILRRNNLIKYDDITFELNCIPGLYKERYTLAFDIRYQLIAFRHIRYSQQYKTQIDNTIRNHWENPYYNSIKLGFIGGLNFKRFICYLKAGYEQSSHLDKRYTPLYVVIGIGFKWGAKPFNIKK